MHLFIRNHGAVSVAGERPLQLRVGQRLLQQVLRVGHVRRMGEDSTGKRGYRRRSPGGSRRHGKSVVEIVHAFETRTRQQRQPEEALRLFQRLVLRLGCQPLQRLPARRTVQRPPTCSPDANRATAAAVRVPLSSDTSFYSVLSDKAGAGLRGCWAVSRPVIRPSAISGHSSFGEITNFRIYMWVRLPQGNIIRPLLET